MLPLPPELFENTPMLSERRRHVRHRTNVETQWIPITGTSSIRPVRIRDISRGGARVEVDHPVVPGQQVRIKLLTVMEARRVYVQPTPEGTWMTGCKFESELSEDEMKVLVR